MQTRARASVVWIVLVLAGLLLLLSSFAVWINRVALNTTVFTDTSGELLADPAIRSAVATRAVDELFDSVDVQAEIKDQLPPDFKSLSGPATAGLRQASYRIVDRALEQPAFQRLFTRALEEAHRTLVEVLEGGGPRVSTEGGEVTLDLQAIVLEAADRIGIGEQVAERIPPDAGRIVILRSDELDVAQNTFQLLKTLAWVLPILTLIAFGAAVVISRDRRRAVRGIGFVLAVAGILGLFAANLTGNYIVDGLVAERENRQAANNAWDILTDLMRGSFRWLIVVGAVFVLAAWLAGPGRRAFASRRAIAPGVQRRLWAYLVLGFLTLLLLLTGSVADATRYLTVLVIALLGAVWIELLRAQTLREFPDAVVSTAFLEDARERLSGWWEARRAASTSPAQAMPTPGDVTARLAALADLHTRGELTDDEYAAAKARVLAGE